jgi:hypothetical protein
MYYDNTEAEVSMSTTTVVQDVICSTTLDTVNGATVTTPELQLDATNSQAASLTVGQPYALTYHDDYVVVTRDGYSTKEQEQLTLTHVGKLIPHSQVVNDAGMC